MDTGFIELYHCGEKMPLGANGRNSCWRYIIERRIPGRSGNSQQIRPRLCLGGTAKGLFCLGRCGYQAVFHRNMEARLRRGQKAAMGSGPDRIPIGWEVGLIAPSEQANARTPSLPVRSFCKV